MGGVHRHSQLLRYYYFPRILMGIAERCFSRCGRAHFRLAPRLLANQLCGLARIKPRDCSNTRVFVIKQIRLLAAGH